MNALPSRTAVRSCNRRIPSDRSRDAQIPCDAINERLSPHDAQPASAAAARPAERPVDITPGARADRRHRARSPCTVDLASPRRNARTIHAETASAGGSPE
ncbi:hypothetical protein MGALJ_61930 (plasmid) [Mycobacterium gallinarum]|uniref:Uncharacterized protein n=1 Tax=Mycobacterium gallinarum TaxID=39689 RepID=A0A9W4BQZ8_9MYCO|nr:hypothetical protein MGALJ_61930 [Mycobacterium gallinarum]